MFCAQTLQCLTNIDAWLAIIGLESFRLPIQEVEEPM